MKKFTSKGKIQSKQLVSKATNARTQSKPSSVVGQSETLAELRQLGREKCIVDEIRKGYSAFRSRHHREFRGELARLYGVAWFLREEPDAWFDFCRDLSWGSFRGRPKVKDREQALRHVLRIAVGFEGRRSTNLVNKYLKRTEGFFDARVSPSIAAVKISRGKRYTKSTVVSEPDDAEPQPKNEYATIRIPMIDGGDAFLNLDANRIVVLLEITEKKGRTRTARMVKFQIKDGRPTC